MDTTGLTKRLQAVLPGVRARRQDIERERRLPREIVSAFKDTGVFALEVPRALGGAEATPGEILAAIELVSGADGSTGWCVGLGIANNGISGVMSEAGAREAFADPLAPSAGVFAPSGAAVRSDGGVRVSGRWQFASGVTHADWVWLGCMVMENGKPRMTPMGPEIIHVMLPTSSVEIHDTWHVSGLCGTGSLDLSARDVFVPEARIFHVADPSTFRPEPLYHLPMVGWFVAHVAAVALGIARGALDELIELAQTRVPTFSTAVLADRPAAQLELARAEADLAAARAFLYDAVEAQWRAVRAGHQPAPREVALGRLACCHAANTAAEVTRKAATLAGGGAIFTASPFQRHVRDADALAHHFTVAATVWEDAGRVLMGRQPQAPMF
jgi:alkylation response protein AidB-like acyl-CoA dehydrogenase